MKSLLFTVLLGCSLAASYGRVVLPRYAVGHKLPENKIVGGSEVAPNSLPFQVSVQRIAIVNFVHTCGGTVLTENTILTSANCVEGVNDLTILRVVAGEHSISENSGLEQYRNVSKYLLHPDYNYDTLENDIALIYVDVPFDLSVPSVMPISMPPPTDQLDPPAGILTTTSGWGYTSVSSSMSDVLNSVQVPVVSDEDCNKAYATEFKPNPVTPSMMCAAGENGGIDACTGDSGGPLFTGDSKDGFVQHGIVSWGRGCALAAYPGVYTQVSYFLEWINENKK